MGLVQPMELTIESALSPGGLVGHLSYLLMVLSMMMRSMGMLRILVILSAIVAIIYDTVWLRDPVGLFWESLLVLVNVYQLVVIFRRNYTASFSEEERKFVGDCLWGLGRGEARQLLDLGEWVDFPGQTKLTTEGVRSPFLYYVASGDVEVIRDGRTVAHIGSGQFVGEMSLLDEDGAAADTYATRRTRCWRVGAKTLDAMNIHYPQLRTSMIDGIGRDLKRKLMAS